MALLNQLSASLLDVAKRTDPSGKIAMIIEMEAQRNEWIQDVLTMECNDGSGHKTTVRTGIPQAAWRMLNAGVPATKSHTAQVRDTTGMLETYAEIDCALAEMAPDPRAYRASEAMAFVEGMTQQVTQTFFYGNTNINPERFLGLSPRYGTVTLANADSADNVVDGGGTGSTNSSLWFVTWGDDTTHMIHPQGTPVGLQQRDLGEDTKVVGNLQYQIYRDHFKWNIGLSVRDWRYNVRLCNLESDPASGSRIDANDNNLNTFIMRLIEAHERMFNQRGGGRTVIYCNRYVRMALRKAVMQKIAGSTLTMQMVGGQEVLTYMGIPVRLVDQLLRTEARIV
jgi:hypothetical protein